MDPEFYSYWQHPDQSNLSFGFRTSPQGIEYAVVVEHDQRLFDGFPDLLANGYLLAFYFHKNQQAKPVYDEKIYATIVKIIADVFAELGKEAVLLYLCDNNDNKQKCRHRLFEKWYKKSKYSVEFINDTAVAKIPHHEGMQEFYFGYITSIHNPNLLDIKEAFEELITLYSFRDTQK